MFKIKNFKLVGLAVIFSLAFTFLGYSYFCKKSIPKISVIIPIYNTEKYLDECLRSVEAQTLEEIEIICINDGSTDNCFKILEEHKNKDKRIRVITQENAGLSEARNSGMNVAKGEYIAFLDSDDFILPYTYYKAYQNIKNYDADVLEYGVYNFEDGSSMDKDEIKYIESNISVRHRNLEQNPFKSLNLSSGGVVWNKIWKTSLIKDNNLKFKKGISPGEDSLFNWLTYPLIRKSVRDYNELYCYRTNRKGSIMNSLEVLKVIENDILIIQELIDNYPVKFNFQDADSKIIEIIFSLTHDRIINEIPNLKDKIYYSKKTIDIVESFINNYSIKLTPYYINLLEDLKQISNKI